MIDPANGKTRKLSFRGLNRPMRKQIAFLIVLVTAAISALTAGPVESSKEVTPVQTQPPENPWSFTLAPYGWATAINGTIGIRDRSADIDVGFKDIFKKIDAAFMVIAQVRYKRWALTGDLLYARLHDDIAPPRGILFSSTHEVLKETIGNFELNYRVFDEKTFFIDAFAGARVYNFFSQIVLRPNLARQGVNLSATETWADPTIGFNGRYYISRPIFLHLYGDIGGFGVGSEFSWQALGGVGIQASRWCDLELGYRALGFDYEAGNSKVDIITHGFISGVIIRF